MANELEITFQGSGTIYSMIRRRDDAQVWSTAGDAFGVWADGSLTDYSIALADRGGDLYQGDWPTLMSPQAVRVHYYLQDQGSPATTDLLLATHDTFWNGASLVDPEDGVVLADALTALEAIKRYLRITDTSEDALLIELINQVSDRVCKICSRRFRQRRLRERHRPGAMGYIVMNEYPIVAVHRVAAGAKVALAIEFQGQAMAASAAAIADEVSLRSVSTAGTVTQTSLSFSQYPSTSSLATAISLVTDWSATVQVDVLAADLIPTVQQSCLATEGELTFPDQTVDALELDLESGTVRVAAASGRTPVTVDYDAGYAVIPEDLVLVTHELIAQAFHLGTRDTSLRGETIGSYSYWLANAVEVSEAQYARLRGYMSVAAPKGVAG